MASDDELQEMAKDLYKRLGGIGNKDARIVRALLERWQSRNLTSRAVDEADCGEKYHIPFSECGFAFCPRCGSPLRH